MFKSKLVLDKVTWYSKLAAVIIFAATFYLGMYLGRQFPIFLIQQPCQPVVSVLDNKPIKVSLPQANQKITSPLLIKGEARGNWYFEASFLIKLVDDNGKVLAQTQGQAKGDWMTQNFVPFEAKLVFLKPTTPNGKLILSKDNPSGLPQNDDQIIIPIKF